MVSKSELLKSIHNELRGVPNEKTVDLAGHKYTFKVLNREEESFAKEMMSNVTNPVQMISDQSAPVLAVALRSIDNTTVGDLFSDLPDDLSEDERDAVKKDNNLRKRFMFQNALEFLNELPGPFVQELWIAYIDLKDEVREAIDKLGPLSKTTPSSASKPM